MMRKLSSSDGSAVCSACGYRAATVSFAFCPGCGCSFVPATLSRTRRRIGWFSIPPMLYPILAALFAGLAISLPVTWFLVRAGHKVGALDSSGAEGHDKQLRAVPNIGGVGIFHAITLPILIGILGVWLIDVETWSSWLPAIKPHLARIKDSTPIAVAMLACMTALHIMGLVDDRRGLQPLPKFIIQFGVAAVMTIFFDVRLLTRYITTRKRAASDIRIPGDIPRP